MAFCCQVRNIVSERIREDREPYYAALRAADRAWAEGHFDVSQLADYLSDLLKAQLVEAISARPEDTK